MAKVTDVMNTTETITQPTETAKEIAARLDQQMETVFLRPAEKGDEQVQKVYLNGKKYEVRRGVPTRVPRPVFEILMRSEDAQIASRKYEEQQEKQYADMAKKLG